MPTLESLKNTVETLEDEAAERAPYIPHVLVDRIEAAREALAAAATDETARRETITARLTELADGIPAAQADVLRQMSAFTSAAQECDSRVSEFKDVRRAAIALGIRIDGVPFEPLSAQAARVGVNEVRAILHRFTDIATRPR